MTTWKPLQNPGDDPPVAHELLELGTDRGPDAGREDGPRTDIVPRREPPREEEGGVVGKTTSLGGRDVPSFQLLQMDDLRSGTQVLESDL